MPVLLLLTSGDYWRVSWQELIMDREGNVSLSDVFSARDISIVVVEWELSGLSHLLTGPGN